jgi:hypothetical protein
MINSQTRIGDRRRYNLLVYLPYIMKNDTTEHTMLIHINTYQHTITQQ